MTLVPGTHGVVIVHGIGDQRPGDTIAEFAKALCDTLFNSPAETPAGRVLPEIQLKSDVSARPPSVTLQITSPGGKDKTTWVCQEAYWNDAFPTPPPTQVLWWGVNQNLGKQIGSLLAMLDDPSNEGLPNQREREKEQAKLKSGAPNAGTIRLSTRVTAPVVAKSGVISSVALVVITPITYVLLGLIWLLHFIPPIGPLDKAVSWVRKIDPFLSSSLGDIERYIDQEIWSANARARVENIVNEMLQRKDIEDITIVAHSMGAVVAYDALGEGGNVAQTVARLSESERKKITFVTVGGAINRVFSMVSSDLPKAEKEIKYNDLQITRPLARVITGYGDAQSPVKPEDRFYWLDIFARRDPVPAGPIRDGIIARAGIDPLRQIKERKVINKDSMIFDHVTYWANEELVMPRIVRAINRGTDYPWPEAGITREKVARRIKIALRYANLVEVVLFLGAVAAIVFVVLNAMGVI